MGKLCQISTELWPLIYVKILFPGSYLEHLLTKFLQTCYEFILGRSGLGLKMGKFAEVSTELWPLNYVKILFHYMLRAVLKSTQNLCFGAKINRCTPAYPSFTR